MTRRLIVADVYSRSAKNDMLSALRDARIEADLSTIEVDQAARLKPGTCARLETELVSPSRSRGIPVEAIERIARLMGVAFRLRWEDK